MRKRLGSSDIVAHQLKVVRPHIAKLFEAPSRLWEALSDVGLYVLASPKRKRFYTGWSIEDDMRNAVVFFSEAAARQKRYQLPRHYRKWEIIKIGTRQLSLNGKDPLQVAYIPYRQVKGSLPSAMELERTNELTKRAPRRRRKQ